MFGLYALEAYNVWRGALEISIVIVIIKTSGKTLVTCNEVTDQKPRRLVSI